MDMLAAPLPLLDVAFPLELCPLLSVITLAAIFFSFLLEGSSAI
jgi:hypothetical protein